MGDSLQRRYPWKEFYVLEEDPSGFAFHLSPEDWETLLLRAIRVGLLP